jgi:DNA-binding transcriptional ArsR family regulator
MARNYVMIDLDDPRTSRLADVISNKTCKHILGALAEQELSESELAHNLKVPLNTINYNVKKLFEAGLVEKTKTFWSSRGRKVQAYRISEKKIVISPKTFSKGVIPALIGAGLFALVLKMLVQAQQNSDLLVRGALKSAESTSASLGSAAAISVVDHSAFYSFLASAPNSWAWFFLGSLVALLIVVFWNWNK